MKILDFPELCQTYEYDCGATALEAVFIYYGIEIKEGLIINQAKTSKSRGTSVKHIEITAKKYGFKVDSKEIDIPDIKKYIDKKIPVILLLQAWKGRKNLDWKKDWDDGHYVVAIGYDKEKIYFEDPYTFERTFLKFEELKKRWHGGFAKGKKYINHGIAIFGKTPKFNSKKRIHMN
ncbi:MAG: cysteine peptidase family C39 domain-containing protein [Nanoarchaeota archaeon]